MSNHIEEPDSLISKKEAREYFMLGVFSTVLTVLVYCVIVMVMRG